MLAPVLLSGGGAFQVRRGEGDIEAIAHRGRAVPRRGDRGDVPGGHAPAKGLRKKREARAHTGAARIALDAGVPLVPAAIDGTDRLRRLGPLRVAYGEPLARRPDGLDHKRAATEATERLMARIEELEATL